MPAPVVYVFAVLGTVAACLAFHEFVWTPHLEPVLDRWADELLESHRERQRRRQLQRQGNRAAAYSVMHESDSRSRSSVASPDDVTHEMQRMSSPKKSTGSATLSPVDDWRKAVDSTGFAATGTLRLRRPVAYQQIRPIYDSSGVMTAATENHEIGNSPPTDCTSPAQFPTARLVSPPSLSFTYDHSQDPTMSPPVMLSPSLSSARANSPFAQATPSSRRSSASYVHDFSSPNIQPTSPLAAEMDISTTADDSSAADFMSAISNMTVQRSDRFNVGSEDGSDFDVLSVRSGSHFDLDGTASEASLSSWASARNQ